ncbi:hypothetical protein LDG_8439 [Legionella drancourtii LLAP12]|uniref:Uncharacterized protein n=1 Tax=Legionella drancourtii LLAP12 TaxID=658187 RepID=G9ET10_9GAMM|nr:hypothetical protein LDG_8439 [Legionella drancourtii LLAP12]
MRKFIFLIGLRIISMGMPSSSIIIGKRYKKFPGLFYYLSAGTQGLSMYSPLIFKTIFTLAR